MKEFIEKLIGRLDKLKTYENPYDSYYENREFEQAEAINSKVSETIDNAISIANELAEEYKHDMVTQLAMMYAKNIYVYGVDVTKAWESAVQNHMALEKAYIRGRQDESDKFAKWKEEHSGGWIPCSERLPEVEADVLLSLRSLDVYTGFRANTEGCFYVDGEGYVEFENVLAWQPLPSVFKPKGE